MDPLITSALVSAGSSMLGGIFGGGKVKRPSATEQIKFLLGNSTPGKPLPRMSYSQALGIHDANMMKARMKGAEEAGIHPLYAIGAASAGSPVSLDVGGGYADTGKQQAMADMGQGLSRAASAWLTRGEREMEKFSAKLQLENQQLQNDRLRSEIALMGSAATPGMPPIVGGYPRSGNLPLGAADSQPRYLPMVNPDGSITHVTNPDAGDNEIVMLWDFLSKTLPDETKNLVRRSSRSLARPEKFLNKLIEKLERR